MTHAELLIDDRIATFGPANYQDIEALTVPPPPAIRVASALLLR